MYATLTDPSCKMHNDFGSRRSRPARFLWALVISLGLHALLLARLGGLPAARPAAPVTGHASVSLVFRHAPAQDHKQIAAKVASNTDKFSTSGKDAIPDRQVKASHAHHHVQAHVRAVSQQHELAHSSSQARASQPGPAPARAPKRHAMQAANTLSSPTYQYDQPHALPQPAAVAVLLRHALRQHFRYPRLALQNSWEGKVVLGVRVRANGQVDTTRVLHTSGYHLLDHAARQAANAIGTLPDARPLLAGQSLSFRVPVAYHLQH